MARKESDIFWTYAVHRLRAPQTWGIAAVVGTFINLYGLVIVPWLRGVDPVASFAEQLNDTPAVSALTIALAYVFPVVVSVYSSASMLFANRHTESLAQFPDSKPDPVFRVDAAGLVIDAGQQTSELFREHGVKMALWSRRYRHRRPSRERDGPPRSRGGPWT